MIIVDYSGKHLRVQQSHFVHTTNIHYTTPQIHEDLAWHCQTGVGGLHSLTSTCSHDVSLPTNISVPRQLVMCICKVQPVRHGFFINTNDVSGQQMGVDQQRSQRRGEDAIDHWSEQVKLKTPLGIAERGRRGIRFNQYLLKWMDTWI